MNGEERAVASLRAQGLTYRQIAQQLGIPLTRAYKLAAAAPQADAEPEPAALAEDPPEPEPEPEPTPAPPQPGVVIRGFLTGPYRIPTPEDVRRGYTMPGPNGTVIVVSGRG